MSHSLKDGSRSGGFSQFFLHYYRRVQVLQWSFLSKENVELHKRYEGREEILEKHSSPGKTSGETEFSGTCTEGPGVTDIYIDDEIITVLARKYVALNTEISQYVHDTITNNSLGLTERLVAINSVNLGISDWQILSM